MCTNYALPNAAYDTCVFPLVLADDIVLDFPTDLQRQERTS